MSTAIDIIVMGLSVNALAAFVTAFFYQAKVIFRLFADSNSGIGIGDANSVHANLSRFLAGELYPVIRPGWGKAVGWAFLSFLVLFAFAGLSEFLI